VSTELKLK